MSDLPDSNSPAEPTAYSRASLLDPRFLYHAASVADWKLRSTRTYQPSNLDTEGFIHLSSASQLLTPLHSFYLGRSDLILLTIAEKQIAAPVVWEDLYDGGQDFPHVYGPLNLSAVVAVASLPCDEDGRFDWLGET